MTDAIDLSTAILVPSDVREFAVATTITALSTGPNGIDVQFDNPGWPDVIPPTWTGPVYYTLWLGTALGDGVHLAASLNVYRGQMGAGAGDVTNFTLRPAPERAQGQYANNLWYSDSALGQHAATEGETLYAMVTAGGWRGVKAPTVAQRSNVVAFTASSSPRTFTYGQPVPVPVPVPVPQPPSDVLLARLNDLEAANAARHEQVMGALALLLARQYQGSGKIPYLGNVSFTLVPK